MPIIKEPRIETLGFLRNQKLSLSIEFSEEELGKSFHVRIGYILTSRAINKEILGQGTLFEEIIKPKTQDFERVIEKKNLLLKFNGFIGIQFEITIHPIYVTKTYQIS